MNCAEIIPLGVSPSSPAVPVRKKGITSILLTSLSNISIPPNAPPGGAVQVGKDGSLTIYPVPSPAGSAAAMKTRANDFYIGKF